MKPILYSFRRCPYAMRARLSIAYANIPIEHREIALKNKPSVMLQVSPKGTVPILILENGEVIDESLDIMLWALQQHDPQKWLLSNIKQELDLIKEHDTRFKPLLDKYKYAVRFPEHSESYYRAQAEVYLQTLEKRLQTQQFLSSNYPSLVDYAIFPFIRQFANVDNSWFDASPYQHLKAWLTYHIHSRLFTTIMQKRMLWQENKQAP